MDAYLTAITYNAKEGIDKPTRVFQAYSSALRRGGKSWFASLSKQFYIKDNKNNIHIKN